jgi:membrane protein DedA with SNARE-associated domain
VDALLHDIIPWVLHVGPWVIFLVVAAETALFIGLLLPAEATVLLGGFLASRGHFELGHVLLATCGGALLGDQLGYLFGRHYGGRMAAREGVVGRLWQRYEVRAARLFRRRSVLSVTLARYVSFVRTIMPWFAGMSGMEYRRFLAYDVLGVVGWAAASVALGYLAGASWQLVAGAAGTASAVIIALIVTLAVVAALRRRYVGRGIERALPGGAVPDDDGAGGGV